MIDRKQNPEVNNFGSLSKTVRHRKVRSLIKHYDVKDNSTANKTIDFSEISNSNSKTFAKDKGTTINQISIINKQTIEFPAFPQIKKRTNKKGALVEVWLDQALEGGFYTSRQGDQRNTQNSTLESLRRYGLDRRVLKSKNVSMDMIEKIYEKLYVYSKGLSSTFKEVAEQASSKRPAGEGDLIETFWVAFGKIMENQTPYKNSFQLIEKKRMITIEELKVKNKKLEENLMKELDEKQQNQKMLDRAIERISAQTKKLKDELQVCQATLQMTQTSLIQETRLRLKFEEKINHAHASNMELKEKYKDSVQDCKQKRAQIRQNEKLYNQLKKLFQEQTIKTEQLQSFVEDQKIKVVERQKEIIILREQLIEMQQKLLARAQRKESESDQVLQTKTKVCHLSTKIQELKNQLNRSNNILDQERSVVAKLVCRIEELVNVNEQVQAQKQRFYRQNIKILSQKLKFQKQSVSLLQQKEQLTNLLNQLKKETHNIKEDNLLKEAYINKLEVELKVKRETLEHMSQTITDIKQICNKNETSNLQLQNERNFLQKESFQIKNKLIKQEQQIEVLKSQISQMSQKSAKTQTSNDISTLKLQQQDSIIKKKVRTILDLQKKLEANKNQMQQKDDEIVKLKQQTIDLQKQSMESRNKLMLLEQQLPNYVKTVQRQTQQYSDTKRQNSESQLEKEALQMKLDEVSNILKFKTSQISLKCQSQEKKALYYQQQYFAFRQFVHPMLLEDANGQIIRLQQQAEKSKGLNQVNRHLKQTNRQLQKYVLILEKRANMFNQQILKLLKGQTDLQSQFGLLKNLAQKLENDNKKKDQTIEKQLIQVQSLQKNVIEIKQNMVQCRAQNIQLQKQNQVVLSDRNQIQNQLQMSRQKISDLQSKLQKVTKIIQKGNLLDRGIQTETVQFPLKQLYSSQIKKSLLEIGESKSLSKEQKRIENKDFKRALRLTYMRR